MSLFINAFLCIYWRKDLLDYKKNILTSEGHKYLIITLVYVLGIIFYNFKLNYVGFWILVVIVCYFMAINLYGILKILYEFSRKVFPKRRSSVEPENSSPDCGADAHGNTKTIIDNQ